MPVCSAFFKIVIMCGVGDARKIVTFVPNCHYLEQKFSFLFKIHFLVRAHQTTTTKQNHCASDGNAHFGPIQQPTNNLLALV
jgi:hypothetical protein